MAALSLGARERLDNLIFVVNCNLQRLDGPVRGNGKVIQELESIFRGMGWNVDQGRVGHRMGRAARARRRRRARQQDELDGRRRVPEVRGRVAARTSASTSSVPTRACARWSQHLTDEELQRLPRGGHDYRKLYAAYKAAVEHEGSPTVILAKTIKGWTLGPDFEARNATHQIKKMKAADFKVFRDRLFLDIPDDALEGELPPYYHPGTDSPEYEYLHGAPPRARRLPPRTRRAGEARRLPARRDHRSAHGRHRRQGAGVDDDRVHTAAAHADEGAGVGQPRRPDHPRRGADVRHGRAVPRVQDLRAVRSAVRAGRRRVDAVVPRGGERADPRGGHHRGRLDGRLHRRGDRVRDVGSADDPVLRLLLDVRVPARRRPDLVVRRPARSGLPAWARLRAARRSPAKDCNTATDSRRCTRWRIRTAARTTPRSRTRSR